MEVQILEETAWLLVSLGSPDAPSLPAVKRYLKAFLGDPAVIDLPSWARSLLLHGFIVPIRSNKTLKAYQQIWTEQGAPLKVHTAHLAEAIRTLEPTRWVRWAMRHGEPSLETVLSSLPPSIRQLKIIPLFPQYAAAIQGSILKACQQALQKRGLSKNLDLIFIDYFFDKPPFIEALRIQLLEVMATWPARSFVPDHWIFSYHGLPWRQLRRLPPDSCAQCSPGETCPSPRASFRCYRAQAFQTTRLIAEALALPVSQYTTSFQSRLGALPWTDPYTDALLPLLYQKGHRQLALLCPSFVADCLETLEEIGIRAKAQWLQLGGTALELIPCLNAHPAWVHRLRQILTTC